ncbi:MAG: TetR/AcrR family transcriptional regulator [Firmicutes bacterium]|nr:TetR/AcrR family transcriptional regulator [Bacillota bacterium]
MEGTPAAGWVEAPHEPATKRRILRAAADVFADKGYYAAAVDDIVRASDTSKGSFYHFFPNKQGVFLSLVDHMYAVLLGRVEAAIERERGALNKVDAALRAVVAEFSRHRRLSRILLIEAKGLGHAFNDKLFQLHSGFAGLIRRYLDRAVAEGSIAPVDTELAAYAWLGAINEVVIRWLHTGQPDPLERALPELRAMLLRSIGASPEREPGEGGPSA